MGRRCAAPFPSPPFPFVLHGDLKAVLAFSVIMNRSLFPTRVFLILDRVHDDFFLVGARGSALLPKRDVCQRSGVLRVVGTP